MCRSTRLPTRHACKAKASVSPVNPAQDYVFTGPDASGLYTLVKPKPAPQVTAASVSSEDPNNPLPMEEITEFDQVMSSGLYEPPVDIVKAAMLDDLADLLNM